MRRMIACAACALGACGFIVALSAAPGGGVPASVRQAEQLARQTVGPNDGWAAYSTGTTGGAAAAGENVYVVTNRNELSAALKLKLAIPRIIIVVGTIDTNVDDNDQPLACADYAAPGYTLEAYLAAYDPAVWGKKIPSGPLETARLASTRVQQGRMRLDIPANTTMVGVGRDARIVGAHMRVNKVDNVIIRNITFADAFDCFPQWDPTDGATGNWNSAYDLISVDTSTHVWIDHCAFNDGAHPDSAQPYYFGRIYQQHDGAVDITKAADLVTVSWNQFTNHDKVMLIGSSDSLSSGDMDKLRVTVHHNLFAGLVQRQPRVRFGKVHVYNNYYLVDDHFSYAWGVGVMSQIFAENNFFEVLGKIDPADFIDYYKKTPPADSADIGIFVGETLVNGPAVKNHVDVLNEYNAAASASKQLVPTVNWSPTLHEQMHPTAAVPALVTAKAGPFTLNEK